MDNQNAHDIECSSKTLLKNLQSVYNGPNLSQGNCPTTEQLK